MQNGYLVRRVPSTDKLGACSNLAPAAFPPRFASVASRCSCNSSQEEHPVPAFPLCPRGWPELERDGAEDETEERQDREVERRHEDRGTGEEAPRSRLLNLCCFWRARCATNVHQCPRAINKSRKSGARVISVAGLTLPRRCVRTQEFRIVAKTLTPLSHADGRLTRNSPPTWSHALPRGRISSLHTHRIRRARYMPGIVGVWVLPKSRTYPSTLVSPGGAKGTAGELSEQDRRAQEGVNMYLKAHGFSVPEQKPAPQ